MANTNKVFAPTGAQIDLMRSALEAIAEFWGDHPVPLSPHALLTDSETLEIRTQVLAALNR